MQDDGLLANSISCSVHSLFAEGARRRACKILYSDGYIRLNHLSPISLFTTSLCIISLAPPALPCSVGKHPVTVEFLFMLGERSLQCCVVI